MLRFLLCLSLTLASASACSVPVFRYALEHWAADPFQITIFHRGKLADDQRALLPADSLANAKVRLVDLESETADDLLALWQGQKTTTLPWIVVRFPQATGITEPVLAGTLADLAPRLFDSPARKEIIDRLATGESAVWVLLESGDRAKDDAAAALIEQRLDYLMSVMTLPKLDQQDIVNGLISISEEDLRLQFSLLRVSRQDQAERAFTLMLLSSERGLAALNEPMVFPIFGRGRALHALVGAGIRHETIEQAAAFLVGKCSCQVKEQNPGVDLLLSADWTTLIKTAPDLARKLPALAQFQDSQPVAVTTKPAPPPDSPQRHPLWLLAVIYGISPLFMALAVLWAWKKRVASRSR